MNKLVLSQSWGPTFSNWRVQAYLINAMYIELTIHHLWHITDEDPRPDFWAVTNFDDLHYSKAVGNVWNRVGGILFHQVLVITIIAFMFFL